LLSSIIPPSDDILTESFVIPNRPSDIFYPGDKVSILIGFENIGKTYVNITDVFE
jgi:hypothetical protein